MEPIGKEALANLITQISGLGDGSVDPDTLSEDLWPQFKAAVAGALAEIDEAQAEGIAKWREARQADKAEESEG